MPRKKQNTQQPNFMRKLLLLLNAIFLLTVYNATAQVGIGTDMPNLSTQLEIVSGNRGVLIPQIPLTSITDQNTISAGNIESLLVYNTNVSDSLSPGYYYWYEGSWRRLLIESDLPDYIVFWDIVNNQFTYIDQNGDIQIINISDLETLTFLALNADGKTLEYTDEDGVVSTIDLEAVIKNFETLTSIVSNNDGTFTYTDELGNPTIIDISNLETLTYLALNADGKTIEYTDENGTVTPIDLQQIIKNFETLTTLLDNNDGTFSYKNEDGDIVTFDANTTTMVNNGDGTYTFTNANGDTITVDVIGDVVTNIQNQGAIYNEIINLINAGSDIFVDNGDGTFTHTTVSGDIVIFDANTTTMVNNGDGTYTFTNANGDTITVDVIGDVVTNIQNQGAIYNEIINLINAGSDIFVDNNDGTFTHTTVSGDIVTFDANTTTMVNNGDGTYTFTNANGDTITVDVIGDVVTNIQNQGAIYNEIINLINANSDVFVDNGDGTFTHTAADGDVQIFDANTTTMVNNGDGTYTFTNANGDTITVDVIGDVVTNIQNQGDIYDEIINIFNNTAGSDIFVDNNDGTFTHTTVSGDIVIFDANTTTIVNNGDGTYTFTNANGDTITVDVIGDVVTNIQNQGAIYNEIINLINAGSDIFVDNIDGTFTHTTVNGDVVIFDANTTTMVNNGDGTYIFTNTNGDTITVDVIGDVVTNIQNQGAIYDEIIALIGNTNSDILIDNGNGTFTHTAVDGTIVIFDANTTTMLNNGDGTYTFTNANGDTITINTNADNIAFDNTNNTFTSTNVQDALEELLATIETNKGDLTVEGGLEFTGTTDGIAKLLADAGIQIADGGVTAEKLNGGIGADGRVGVADDQGNVTYQNLEDLVQGNQLTTTVVGANADVVVTPTVTNNNTEFSVEVKAAMPKFFYMPAIIFDTSVLGSFTKELHQEYIAQFTGTSNPTLVGSSGAPSTIPHLPAATDLYYYITYYDTDVFSNIVIDANGVLTYNIIGEATEASYMTIIFVVK